MIEYTTSPLVKNDYNTDINVIGSLKDLGAVLSAFESYFCSEDSLNSLISQRNGFNLRTVKSRTRIEHAVRKSFLTFYNKNHEELIQGIFKHNSPQQDKELVLFWHFALNNKLFREISINIFTKIYFSGRVTINKDDITAYVKDFIFRNNELRLDWSEKTTEMIGSKYLNLMSKLNLLNAGRTKKIKLIKPSSEAQVLFLYFAKLFNPDNNNIITNGLLPLLFLPADNINATLKKLSSKGYFNMSFNGVALNIELIHSYKGVCNVLYN